jgi:hypothetical protein
LTIAVAVLTAGVAAWSGLAFAGVEPQVGPIRLPALLPDKSQAVSPAAPAKRRPAAEPAARPPAAAPAVRVRARARSRPAMPPVTRKPAVARQYPVARITICHHATRRVRVRGRVRTVFRRHVTIRVARSTLRAHRRHGDTVGRCTARALKRFHSSRTHVRRYHRR